MRPLLILALMLLAGCPKVEPSAKPSSPIGTQTVSTLVGEQGSKVVTAVNVVAVV